MTRAPLAKGDDGSSNRYPVRHNHVITGLAYSDCPACVPAALQVPTPERFDPSCEGDE